MLEDRYASVGFFVKLGVRDIYRKNYRLAGWYFKEMNSPVTADCTT
jgi:hypothetical protein